jgi:hypothetical protein
LPGVVIEAALGRQAFRVEDICPVRVTPAGSSDVDRHNGYSVIANDFGLEVRGPAGHAESQQAGFGSMAAMAVVRYYRQRPQAAASERKKTD